MEKRINHFQGSQYLDYDQQLLSILDIGICQPARAATAANNIASDRMSRLNTVVIVSFFIGISPAEILVLI